MFVYSTPIDLLKLVKIQSYHLTLYLYHCNINIYQRYKYVNSIF